MAGGKKRLLSLWKLLPEHTVTWVGGGFGDFSSYGVDVWQREEIRHRVRDPILSAELYGLGGAVSKLSIAPV